MRRGRGELQPSDDENKIKVILLSLILRFASMMDELIDRYEFKLR